MTATGYLRPREASKRFGVSERTLARWAEAGLIGRSVVGRVTLYPASDVAELIASRLTRRMVVPMPATGRATTDADDAWRGDELWAGTVAAEGSPAPAPSKADRRAGATDTR